MSEINSMTIFADADGLLMPKSLFRSFWEHICKKINIAAGGDNKFTIIAPDITPHIFRHTFATSLFNAGVDVKTAQYL